MNLDQLIACGAIIQPSLLKKTVTWKNRDDDGVMQEYTFDVHIKKEMSGADFEFIFSNRLDEDDVVMARRVHRLVTLGENGEEKIPYEAAASMKPGLLLSLCAAINEIEKEDSAKNKEPEGETEKK